jgi:hypothetical protein
MTRSFAIAAILALTAAATQAEPLSAQVHDAAVKACAVEASTSLPASHYAVITQSCIDRISSAALRRIAADAEAKTLASTASLAAN